MMNGSKFGSNVSFKLLEDRDYTIFIFLSLMLGTELGLTKCLLNYMYLESRLEPFFVVIDLPVSALFPHLDYIQQSSQRNPLKLK